MHEGQSCKERTTVKRIEERPVDDWGNRRPSHAGSGAGNHKRGDRGRLVREIKRDTGVNTVWTIDGMIFCTQYEDCCEVKRFVACHMQSARVRYNQNKRTSEWKKLEAVQESICEVETRKHKGIEILCESRDMTPLR